MDLLLVVVSIAAVSVLAVTVKVMLRGLHEQSLQTHRHHERRSRREQREAEDLAYMRDMLEFCDRMRVTRHDPALTYSKRRE